ncbi:F-box domain-containing protein [Pleurotus pulmonarius]
MGGITWWHYIALTSQPVLRTELTTQTTTAQSESKVRESVLSLAMAQLLKTPPEVSLRIAGYLPKQRDCLALSLVSRVLRGVGEQALYSNIVLRLKHDAATDNIVELFYHAIKANQARRDWVRSLSVIALRRTFTTRERKLIHRILCMLPRLINFSFEYPPVDGVDGNPFDLRRCFSYSAPLKSSLRTFAWLHAEILDDRAFKSFLNYHSNIKYLAFDEDAFDVPKIGSQVLPNLESLRAPIDAVLRMLPKRRVQRIKTVINRSTLPDWKTMRDTHFESIRVFSPTIHRNDDVTAQALLDSLIRRMVNLEFLDVQDETVIAPLTLKNTKLRFLRLRNLRNEFLIGRFFDELPLLECIEVKFRRNAPMNSVLERFYGDGRGSRTILWECKPNEEWLHDWRDVVIV